MTEQVAQKSLFTGPAVFTGLVFFALLLLHCQQPPQQQTVSPVLPQTTPSPGEPEIPLGLPVREIAGNFFDPWRYYGEADIFFPDDADTATILTKLFPGQLIENDSDDPLLQTGWTCPACPKILLDNDLLYDQPDEKLGFPFQGFNFTQLISDRLVTPDKRVIAFSTSESSDLSGRFSGGVLGMAILEKTAGGWKLTRFAPAIDYQGRYSASIPPDTILSSGNQLFFPLAFRFPCGPPSTDYSPCWTDFKLYATMGGSIKKLLEVKDFGCSTANSVIHSPEWSSSWYFESCSDTYCPLNILTVGRIEKNEGFLDIIKDLAFPKALIEAIRTRDSFDFLLKQTYTFQYDRYMPNATSVEINPLGRQDDSAELLITGVLEYTLPIDSIWKPYIGEAWFATGIADTLSLANICRAMEFNICVDREGDVVLLNPVRAARSAAESEAMQYAQYSIPEKVHFGLSKKDFRFGKVTIHLE